MAHAAFTLFQRTEAARAFYEETAATLQLANLDWYQLCFADALAYQDQSPAAQPFYARLQDKSAAKVDHTQSQGLAQLQLLNAALTKDLLALTLQLKLSICQARGLPASNLRGQPL